MTQLHIKKMKKFQEVRIWKYQLTAATTGNKMSQQFEKLVLISMDTAW